MPTVGLLINEDKAEAVAAAERLTRALLDRGIAVRAAPSTAERIGEIRCGADLPEVAAADFVVVLGGDGTLLAAARALAPCGTPILGIHLGRFGFIAEALPDALLSATLKVVAGEAGMDERMMLACAVRRGDTREELPLGLNDVVVKSAATRMVHVRTAIGSDEVATYAADGVIVASPTGSTGYSLSAGGPLVHPSAPVLLITPVCPHTLNARSLVVPDTETIHLTLVSGDERDSVLATVDGQVEVSLHAGNAVEVRRAPHNVRLLTVGGPNFYHKIRARWRYGERLQS